MPEEAPTVDEETAESLPEDEETITLEETVDAADDEIINAEENTERYRGIINYCSQTSPDHFGGRGIFIWKNINIV